MRPLLYALPLAALLGLAGTASAQNAPAADSASHFEPSISELLELPIDYNRDVQFSSGSLQSGNIREVPGIATVITQEEIRLSGARELADLLRMVPGFHLGKSDDNVVSIGVRGLWSDDGKVLFVLDGMILNDLSYGSVPLGQRIPLDHIERIEIVRGPGSALYGGFASVAVVRIFTHSNDVESQVQAHFRYGMEGGVRARAGATLSANHKSHNGARLSLSAHTNQGRLSTQDLSIPNGEFYSYRDSSQASSYQIQGNWSFKGWSVGYLSERVTHAVAPYGYSWFTQGNYFRAEKEVQVGRRLSITPRFFWKQQQPWSYFDDPGTTALEFNTVDRRLEGKVTGYYELSRRALLAAGISFHHDQSRLVYDYTTFANGERKVGYHTVAAFSELNYHSRWGNITAGWRFERHSAVDPAFVPRLAYTKAWDRWHLKALYTYAFRTPGIQNINLAVDAPIRPELSRVAEAEIGYRVPGLVSITANAFRIDVSDPIVYLFNETDESYTYVNRGRTGSMGGELVAKAAGRWGSATVQWSHYLANNNSIEEFMKEGDSKAMLGMPRNVFGFRGIFHLPNEWALSTQAFWSEARSTYLPFDEDYEDLREVAYPAYWLLDLNVQRTFLWNGQLDVALGVHNLLDEVAYIVAPSNSGLLPLPMHRREIVLSVRYTLH